MTDTKSLPEKAERPHAYFEKPGDVVVDLTLTKDEKSAALEAMEQDARQLAIASDEGMAGGERNKLQDVLVAKDTLELSPTALAYQCALHDLRARLKAEGPGDSRALLAQAVAALNAVMESPSLNPASNAPNPGHYNGPSAGSPAEIADEIQREKLDPGG